MSQALRTRIDSGNLGPEAHLSNDLLSLVIMPEIGGRVMSLALGEENVIYTNPRHAQNMPGAESASLPCLEWRNYGGSKVWPAPQGWSSQSEWPGPPDLVLDSGPYRFQVSCHEKRASVHLQSGHDEYSGITLERTIEIFPGAAIVHLHHKMRNTSQRRVRWSIWQVTQVDAALGLDIFTSARGFHQTLGNEPYLGMSCDPATSRTHLRYQDQVAKFAVEADQGWLASLVTARGIVLGETFPTSPDAEYPDGAPVAFWTSGKGTFTIHGDTIDMTLGGNGFDPHVETEVMGPLVSLAPGESSDLHTSWRMAAIDAKEIVSINDCAAIGRPLRLTGKNSTLTGSFGVFHDARLQLGVFDRCSKLVATFPLGEASPLRPVTLNESISLPDDAVRCSLILLDQNNQQLGTIDHVQIR
jgi:hypothetical protein